MNETIYALWLSGLKGMTPLRCCTLFQYYGSFEKAYHELVKDIHNGLFTISKNNIVLTSKEVRDYQKRLSNFETYYDKLQSKNIQVLTPLDSLYPNKLKEIHDFPITLYKKGLEPIPEFGIAIVGARRCSGYGRKVAHQLAKDLALAGVNVISGLAYGIDIAAHEGALSSGGYTTAVLGGGLNQCYPLKHERIFHQIAQSGCLLSEEPYGVATLPYMFPKRNRIISGLSYGVLVVEAAVKSGSLITVDFALEQGREVFTVPGRLFEPLSEGSNNLIKQGAKIIFNYDDILNEFVHFNRNIGEKKGKIEKKLEEMEKIVYSCISYDPIHEENLIISVFETISQCIGTQLEETDYNEDERKVLASMNKDDVHLALLTLELYGLIVIKSGCYYARSEV